MLAQDISDEELLARAVRDLAQRTRFPVAFGGYAREGAVRVDAIVGTRTRSLESLTIRPHRGLGGRTLVELRPRMTPDYAASRQITHDYDRHVLGEGIAALLAVPVVVDGRARAILYGGSWGGSRVGDMTASAALRVADALAAELRVRDEVARRLAAASAPSIASAEREGLREAYAELRSIATAVGDAALRERIAGVERRLATLSGGRDERPDPAVRLSPRETDVLACAALGSTNAEIAARLGLREGTVKAYLGSAMAKLDASTRHAAVARARRAGLLP